VYGNAHPTSDFDSNSSRLDLIEIIEVQIDKLVGKAAFVY